MPSSPLHSSRNVKEIYWLYEELNDAFLKQFKFQADFFITFSSKEPDFILSVRDASEKEFNWLKAKILELFEEKVQKTS